jgi:hypothetical protein
VTMGGPPANRRRDLLFKYRMEATRAYRAATAAGIALPVVFIIDMQDPAGRRLAEAATQVASMPQLPAPLALAVVPLSRLRAADSPLPPPWRMAMEKITAAGGGPEVYIVMVIADEACFCIPVPLME